MGLFNRLLRMDPAPESDPAPVAPETWAAPEPESHFEPGLIAALQHDHSILADRFAKIGEAHRAGEHDRIGAMLTDFMARFEAHTFAESQGLYAYLETAMQDDADNTATLRDFHRHMIRIAHQVTSFCLSYRSSQFTASEQSQFGRDFDAMDKLLQQRLASEEKQVFPLYRPD